MNPESSTSLASPTSVGTLDRPSEETEPVTINTKAQLKRTTKVVGKSGMSSQHFRKNGSRVPISRETLRGIAFAAGIFLISRIAIAGVIYFGTRLIPGKTVVSALLSWDAGWYYKAIQHGYPHIAIQGQGVEAQNTIAFFPLYPMLVRAVETFTPLSPIQSGITVSIFFGATAAILIWILAREITKSTRTANLSVALFSFFPGSIAALLMMAEGVMLTFTVASLLALHKRQWLLAGICAALATSARPTALPLVICCAWAAGIAIWQRREWRSLIAPVLAPMGTLGYFAFLEHHTGEFLAWFRVEAIGWEYAETERFAPLKTLPSLWNPLVDMNRSMTAVALLLAIAGLALLIKRKLPVTLIIYTLAVCVLAFATGGPASKLRYVWSAFPFFIAAAHWARTEFRAMTLLTTFTTATAVYTLIAVHTNLTIL